MSELIIDGNLIDAPMESILLQLRSELPNGFLRDIAAKGDNVEVTCPFHKDGMESHPSCNVYCGDSPDLEYGYYRCFTCGSQGHLWNLVAASFGRPGDSAFGRKWLVDRFGGVLLERPVVMEPLDISAKPNPVRTVDGSVFAGMEDFHPYMAKRKLSRDVCRRFGVRYDPKTECIVFPVNDADGNLVMLTRRSVEGKSFFIDKDAEKPVYLLDYEERMGLGYAVVCESQINALTCHTYGLCGIALFGTGSSLQYDILNRSGIRYYILCFDGDEAGAKGTSKFLKNIRKDVFVDVVRMPAGKDVNDLSKDEFLQVLTDSSVDWRRLKDAYGKALDEENSCKADKQVL